MPKSPFHLSSTTKRQVQLCSRANPIYSFTQGGERSVLSGDGVAETNLREHPGEARQNERNYNAEFEYEYCSRVAVEQAEIATHCAEECHDVAWLAYRWVDQHDW
ncbi:hypothetical protein BKA56DRAFT_679668 [Ilyonectria sp. MPI-CAGE-AT-0026]|nr:hypothetical protein BKA56DRAFT_679668 [Ilyonectria sp. MPI-CAGE-AT-0026]